MYLEIDYKYFHFYLTSTLTMLVLSSGLWLFSAAIGGWGGLALLLGLRNALLSGGDRDIPAMECVVMVS